MNAISSSRTDLFRWPYLASGFWLLNTIGAFHFVSRWYYGEWQGGFTATTLLATVLNLLFVLVSLALFWDRLRRASSIRAGEFLAISLVVLFILSVAWSIDPSTTLRRAGLYGFFVLGAMGIAAHLDDREFTDLVGTVCFISAVASLVLLVVDPNSAFGGLQESLDGSPAGAQAQALRGIFSHKNSLGQVMAAGSLVSLHTLRARDGKGAPFWIVVRLLVFLGVALASKSSTSVLVILFLYVMTVVICLRRRGGLARVLGTFVALLAVVVALTAALFPDSFVETIGKDPTLTGRTELWDIVITEIFERPIGGWGYFAFWGASNPIANAIAAELGWGIPPHAHNEILEMLLETGVVGTLLMLVIFLRSVWLAWRCLRTSVRELGTSSLLCCGAIAITGVTESVLMDFSHVWTILFFVFWLLCERAGLRGNKISPHGGSHKYARRATRLPYIRPSTIPRY